MNWLRYVGLSLRVVLLASTINIARASQNPQVSTQTGQSPPNCGLLCQAKATISLSAAPGQEGFLEHKFFYISYTVTNTYFADLTGVVHISFNGKPALGLKALGPKKPPVSSVITLTPHQSSTGTVIVLAPASGTGSVDAEFDAPVSCQFSGVVGQAPVCNPNTMTYASSSIGVPIPPDKDFDGLSDDVEDALLETYTPLLLFTKDHDKQEEYAPIDVVDFIRASSLVSKDSAIKDLSNTSLQTPSLILDPTQGGDLGEITTSQININQASLLPRNIYVSPSEVAKHGTPWPEVLAKRKTGLYGHVVPLTVAEIADQALHVSLAVKFCKGDILCAQTVYKVEYWQFFGYSHDFELPKGATAAELAAEALAQAFVPVPLPPIDLKQLAADVIDHGGDWCTVQLYIDPSEPAPDKAVLAVFHYAHGLQFGFDLTQSSVVSGPIPGPTTSSPSAYQIKQFQGINAGKPVTLPFENAVNSPTFPNAQNNVVQFARTDIESLYVHPVVYVEWGGHEFWPSSAWTFAFASKHSGNGYSYFAAPPPNVGELGVPRSGTAAPLVVGFAGYWGYYGWENRNKPPQGPPLHKQWYWPADGQIPTAVRPQNPPF